MALIGKIRKNFWFVLLLLGFALAAFIIMDMTSAGNRAASNPSIGKVAGETISYTDFNKSESGLFQGSSANSLQNRKSLWDFYVEKAILDTEAKKLGLGISRMEMEELQFGPNYSPLISQQLQSGSLNFQQLNEIKNAIETETFTNPNFKNYWSELMNQILKTKKQEKLTNLVSKAVYTPNWMAEENFTESNSSANIAYVKIPFDKVTDPIEVTDQDISDYISKNKARYTRKNESRTIEYISFDVEATQADKDSIRAQMSRKVSGLKNAVNDSLFILQNGGFPNNVYFGEDQLPEEARNEIISLAVGDVYGPFESNGLSTIVKKIDQKVLPDSVTASHILRRAQPGDVAGLAAANAMIDSLQNRYDLGIESFDSLAIKNSEDGSASVGGDLGTFEYGRMVPEFSEVCFISGKEGRKLYKVTSQYGVHLIKINNRQFNTNDRKYKVASLQQPIVPSTQTQDDMYDKVADILSNNKSYDALKAIVDTDALLQFETSKDIEADGFTVGTLDPDNTSRQIVKWAFNPSTELGDVSPEIYEYTDKVNYYDNKYVLATLKGIVPKGLLSVENARDQLYDLVLNKKKADLLMSRINSTNLSALASEYGVAVDTATNVNVAANFVPGLGTEADVIGKAFSLNANEVSGPIAGKSGVFVVSPVTKTPAGDPINIPQMRTTAQNAARSSILTRLIDAWKGKSKIEDNRGTYY